jgi:adenylate cyclase
MKNPRKLMAGVAIGVTAALAAWVLGLVGLLSTPEDITWDARQRFYAQPVDKALPIRVILLDEQSLEWGRAGMGLTWPWPYEVYAPILEFCRTGGAKAIAFDVQFTEPGRYGPGDDQKLADAIAESPDFIAAVAPGVQTSGVSSWPGNLERPGMKVTGLGRYSEARGIEGLIAQRARFPFTAIARGAALLGHIAQDDDSVARRARPFIRFDGSDIPTLGLAAYLVGTGQADAEAQIGGGELKVGGVTIPLGTDGRAKLRYRKPTGAENGHLYRSYSAAAVIRSQLRVAAGEEPSIDPDEFKDSYVFFGLSASGLYDIVPTPVSPLGPGVEVHATFLDQVLNNGFIRDASPAWVLLFVLMVSVCASLSAGRVLGVARLLAVYAIALPIPAAVGFGMFRGGVAWPIAWPSLAVFGSLIGSTLLTLATEGKQRRFIRRAFGHYLSPAVIERVLADPSLLTLGGERREVTVMFIDLEGFTSIAEKLDAQTLASLLNEYLSRMSEVILEEQGTLDKYQGDAVMAFWNAPLDQRDHALRACRAALRCREKLVGLERDWLEKTGRAPRIRIGVHTGVCVVGNMGSKQRFDYTVLGDTANLASRLEGVNKVFGTTALVSEETWSQAGGELSGREVGRVAVVGRAEPIRVFEPYSLDPGVDHPTEEAFRSALSVCIEGRLADAMHRFQDIGHDPVAKAYADKLAAVLQTQDPEWDGVWELLHK